MDAETLESLRQIVDYLYLDEKKDWEANGEQPDHIFTDLERVRKYLDGEL